ncbi:MAG: carboxyl-terminal processing protease [Verrucomicrobiales bacterium]|jgi:carboxyl-terminal processing protease
MAMKSGIQRLSAVLALFSLSFAAQPASAVDYGQVALRVASLLENEHFNDHPIDDKISRQLLENYLDFLDIGRLYFLESDVNRFTQLYQTTLDDRLLLQDIAPAHEIYGIYEQRVNERVKKIEQLLTSDTEFTFDSDRSVQLSRKELPWPATAAASDQIWRNMIEGEVLQEVLRQEAVIKAREERAADPDAKPEAEDGEPEKLDDPREIVLKRYQRILDSLKDNDVEAVSGFFLKSLSHAYDPHSDYMTQSEYNNFMIAMEKQLQGIGALLSMTDAGYAEIRGLVVGGPAYRAGELKVGDRIIAVGQGQSGDSTDITYMNLQKVVDLIRGDKDTIVRLKLIPAGSDGAETKTIFIKREKVDLKESLARAELIETRDAAGEKMLLGWIDLPSFYSDMRRGETSVTRDVEQLLRRLMKENIQGLIVDLRQNGGGSLEEAVNLTGLFIPRGPVVQAVDSRGQRTFKASKTARPVYDGPLVVLTSKGSASASEILAAALQDYGRAVILGERSTFGKGTVQQLVPVTSGGNGLLLRQPAVQTGALKLTIQKFYRIAGGSTQRRGVIPDLLLPSITDAMELGEAALKNPLPYDEIKNQNYEAWRSKPLPFEQLRERSNARVTADPDFKWVDAETARYRERKEENTVSINRAVREEKMAEQEKRVDERLEELKARYAAVREREKGLFTSYSITLDTVNAEELKLVSELTDQERTGMQTNTGDAEDSEEQKALEPPHGIREVKREALSVLSDLVEIERGSAPAALTASQTPGEASAN